MKKRGFLRCGVIAAFLVVIFLLGSPAVFAQDGAAEPASQVVWHYAAAAFGLGLITLAATLGISRATVAAAESIARQPSAASQITATVNLPIFLMEGVAILAEIFVLLIVLLK